MSQVLRGVTAALEAAALAPPDAVVLDLLLRRHRRRGVPAADTARG
jgi:hypothetical protein